MQRWKTACNGRPPPGSACGRGAFLSPWEQAPLCRDQAGKFPGGAERGRSTAPASGQPGAASTSRWPWADPQVQEHARRRQAVLGASACTRALQPFCPPRRPPSRSSAPRRAPTSLPAGRGRVGRNGAVTSAPRGRPWVPPSHALGASRADHSGQGAGRGPLGLRGLTGADLCQLPYSLPGTPATVKHRRRGRGPEI